MSELWETNYEHVKGCETFTVTAAEKWSIGMVRRLKEKFPEQVEIVHVNQDGSVLARMPFDWMRIVPKRCDTLTDEQRAAVAERLKGRQASNPTAGQGEIAPISHDNPDGVHQHTPGATGAEMEAE